MMLNRAKISLLKLQSIICKYMRPLPKWDYEKAKSDNALLISEQPGDVGMYCLQMMPMESLLMRQNPFLPS
jgi:hypothetical protein